MKDPVQRILDANAGRDPERLRLKFAKMRTHPFAFLRGSAHLLHERVERKGPLKNAPPAWCCGDLHLENFGSYKGDNRLSYFDLNDFDEGALAPAAWDALHLLVSLNLAGETLRLPAPELERVSHHLLEAYADALAAGKAYWLERETAQGPVQALLSQVAQRKRADLLAQRCERVGGRLRLTVDGRRTLAASAEQVQAVQGVLHDFASTQPEPRFFEVKDVARRIAGTGSLGLPRFVILVRGKGGREGHYLLDLKAAQPSSLATAGGCAQPRFDDAAQRLVAVQRRMQAVSLALLQPVRLASQPFVLRELQVSEDRLDLASLARHRRGLADTLACMGRLLAWAQLRSSGRQGAANADALIDFGRRHKWRGRLLAQATELAGQVRQDWCAFVEACDAGRVDAAAAPGARPRGRRA